MVDVEPSSINSVSNSNLYEYQNKVLSKIKLCLNNLSSLSDIQSLFIWKTNSEEHLMALSFLCNGSSEKVRFIIDTYRSYPQIHFFNDAIKTVCDGSNLDSVCHEDKPASLIVTNDNEKSSCLYLLVHLFVNIIHQINKYQSHCGFGMEKMINMKKI